VKHLACGPVRLRVCVVEQVADFAAELGEQLATLAFISRADGNATLTVAGRDRELAELRVRFCACRWELVGVMSREELEEREVPDDVLRVLDFMAWRASGWQGTAADLLAAVGAGGVTVAALPADFSRRDIKENSADDRKGFAMVDGTIEEKVHKSLVMDRELGGAFNARAAGAGVGFSEAVRWLCAQALAEWPNAAGAVMDEVRRVEWRLSGEIARISAVLARLESQHPDLLAAFEGGDDEERDPGRYYAYYGETDAEDDESAGDDPEEGETEWGGGFDAEEFDRESDERWEAKKNEWN
jgi:hypothetical protein